MRAAKMSSPTAKKKQHASFLDLPGEVRNVIYRLALPTGRQYGPNPIHECKDPPRNSLVEVGGQVGSEAASIWYAENYFQFCGIYAAAVFLRSMNDEARAMIQHICLEYALPVRSAKARIQKVDDVTRSLRTLAGFTCKGLKAEALFVVEYKRHAIGSRTAVKLMDLEEFKVVYWAGGWEFTPNYGAKVYEDARAEGSRRW